MHSFSTLITPLVDHEMSALFRVVLSEKRDLNYVFAFLISMLMHSSVAT